MKDLSFTITLLSADGRPTGGYTLILQALTAGANRWIELDRKDTTDKGKAKFNPKWAKNMASNVILGWRLTSGSSEGQPIVISGELAKPRTRKGITTVDFGSVQLVETPGSNIFDPERSKQFQGPARDKIVKTSIAKNPVTKSPAVPTISKLPDNAFTLEQKVSLEVSKRTETLFLEKRNLANQLTIAQKNIKSANDERDQMKIRLDGAIKRETEVNGKITALTRQKTELSSRIGNLNKTISQNALTIKNLKETQKTTKGSLTKANQATAKLEREKNSLNKTLLKKDDSLKQSLTRVKVTEDSLRKIESKHKITENKLNAAQTQLAKIKEQVEIKSPIRNIMTNIGSEIQAVNAVQNVGPSKIKIGKIKVKMSGHLADNGQSIIMNSASNPSNANQEDVAVIESELSIGEDESGIVSDIRVPDLIGLTEGAAKRVLASIGLQSKVAYRTMKGRKGSNGQIIDHSPKAGENIDINGSVFLIVKRTSGT